jgi:hypothetical protein
MVTIARVGLLYHGPGFFESLPDHPWAYTIAMNVFEFTGQETYFDERMMKVFQGRLAADYEAAQKRKGDIGHSTAVRHHRNRPRHADAG